MILDNYRRNMDDLEKKINSAKADGLSESEYMSYAQSRDNIQSAYDDFMDKPCNKKMKRLFQHVSLREKLSELFKMPGLRLWFKVSQLESMLSLRILPV